MPNRSMLAVLLIALVEACSSGGGRPAPAAGAAVAADAAAAGAPAAAPAPEPPAAVAPLATPDPGGIAVRPLPPEAPGRIVAAAFDIAVVRAGEKLFADGAARLGDAPRPLVIDPLIDANTASQTVSTVAMGRALEGIIRARYPAWTVKPLTRQSLGESPLLVIGTLTPTNSRQQAQELADLFRIWLTMVDLKTGRIVAKTLDGATVESVDASPTAYYQESPTWHRDKTTMAYVDSCQLTTKVGDPIDPAYLMRLPAAAVVNEATLAYEARRYADAYRLFHEAESIAEPNDLRVWNGLYLTSVRLGKSAEAKEAFARIVAAGLASKRLPVKMLFTPGTTSFAGSPSLHREYASWLQAIAVGAETGRVCLRVVGHTSHTGSAALNEKLSTQRAAAIQTRLGAESKRLSSRLSSEGKGFRENLIGIGTDDLRDALDRRVEFRVVECAVR